MAKPEAMGEGWRKGNKGGHGRQSKGRERKSVNGGREGSNAKYILV